MQADGTGRSPGGAGIRRVGPGTRVNISALLALFLLLGAGAPILHAQEEVSEPPAVEPKSDEEKAEEEKKGPSFIPIPIFITEPAIGYGLGAAIGYFHKKEGEADHDSDSLVAAFTADNASKAGKHKKVPPTVSGIAAAYTDKGTWGAGIAHSASWKKDRVRYVGGLGYAHIVTTVYFGDQPFDFELDTGLLLQDIKFRIKSSNFFLGAKLLYLNPELVFDDDLADVPVDPDLLKRNDFGLAAQAEYDSRDNNMTPNSGQFVELVGWKHLEALGGETDYWKLGLQAQTFHEMMNQKLVLGFHLKLDTAGGDPPIYGYPWITMRGVPALRYQNETAGVLETELRWNILERWAAVGFPGVGATRGDIPLYQDESGVVAGGLGARFLFRPQDSLWVGMDVAKGPEDYVLYIQVGQAW